MPDNMWLAVSVCQIYSFHAGHYYNRIWVITCGCLLWGCMTAAFSRCNYVEEGYIFWGKLANNIPT